jgi:hypothetical protein
MAIIIANDGDRVVATIADRNAIARKFDGMQVTVQDAIADVIAGEGEALYQWSASKSKWILIGKENIDSLEFISESGVLVDGKVTTSEHPQSGLVWDCYVIGQDGSVVADITAPSIVNNEINIGTLMYDGLTIHFSYGFGRIQATVAALIDVYNLGSLDSSTPSNMSGFVYGTGTMISAKSLTASDVTDFTTEVAALTQSAIDSKAPIANPTFTGTVAGVTKGMVGLGSVDNTSDMDKPVSTAQQTALDTKAELAGSATQNFTTNTLTVSGNILPAGANIDLGSTTQRFKTIFVDEAKLSTNTLYIGDTAILGTTAQTVNIHTDPGQSLDIQTSGSGTTVIQSVRGVNVSTTGMNSPVQLNAYGTGSNVVLGATNEIQMTATGIALNAPVTASSLTSTGNLTVGGNLVVNGTQTTINSTTVTTKDNIIILNNGEAGSGVTAGSAGFRVDRGDLVDYELSFDESDDFFKIGAQGSTEIIATRPWATTTFAAANHNHTIDSLSNVSTASKGNNDVFKWNGTAWTNGQISKSEVGLGNVDNTADSAKPVSTAQAAALALKADAANPTFTGTVTGVTATMVGLGSVDNVKQLPYSQALAITGDATASSTNLSTGTIAVTLASVGTAGSYFKVTTDAKGRVTAGNTALVAADIPDLAWSKITSGTPTTLSGYGITDAQPVNTKLTGIAGLSNLATGLVKFTNGTASIDSTAYLTSGTVTATMVGLNNVENTADADKPVSTAQQAALDLKAPLASPTFTGTVGGITKSMVGLGLVDNTADLSKPISTATQTALDLKAPSANPTFTGTVSGITKSMVGLANVNNTADLAKPISTATQTALDLKADQATTYTKTETDSRIQAVVGAAPAALDTLVELATALGNDASYASTITSSLALKAPLASPTFTGTVSGITAAMVGLGSVTNDKQLKDTQTLAVTGDATATATALNTGTIALTLATVTDSGTGSFKKVTVNGKGLVTGTAAVAEADITGLLGAGSITNTMLANAAVANLSGTNTGDETAATIKTKLGVSTLSGSNTGDQTITLTGDASGSGTGSFSVTLASVGTAGSYYKVTTDVKGRVTSGVSALVAADIPALDWAKITSGKPTTLAGYGITDAAAASHTQAWSTITSTPTTLAGYGITDAGYLNIPQVSNSANYTTVLSDSGKHLLHPAADTTARTFTIAANASVAYPIGTTIAFVNQNGAGALTIAIATDTMRLAGAGTTGSRTLAANGIATAVKITSTEWIISGTNLT